MYAKIFAAACAAMLLGGCAGGAGLEPAAADHPANPNAAAAPLAPASTTLAVVPAQSQPAQAAPASGPVVYVCPHHPEVTSTNPDDRCPKCHMKLVRRDGPAGEGE
jgi:hypothetical protein